MDMETKRFIEFINAVTLFRIIITIHYLSIIDLMIIIIAKYLVLIGKQQIGYLLDIKYMQF